MVIGVRFMRVVSVYLAEGRLRPEEMGQRFQQPTSIALSNPRAKSAVFAR
jgi:hypothetical protein